MMLVPRGLNHWVMFSTVGFLVDVVPPSRSTILPNATTAIALSKLRLLSNK